MTLSAATLAFSAYMRDKLLARDLDVLVGCGRVQEAAIRDGDDTPAGWFERAARSYVGDDAQGVLARRACELVAAQLRGGPIQ